MKNALRIFGALELLCAFLSAGVFESRAQSQSQYQLPTVIPPSPTASALGKYGDVPASLFSGTPSVGVPLFELSSKELSLPISLSYSASGVKIEDVASWVGVGWSLNGMGVITRSVRGRPDEDAGRLTNGIPDTPAELSNTELVETYAKNILDPEPDVYYYNFNGRSGQMMFDDAGQYYTTTAEKIKFEKTNKTSPYESWILVDESGIRYHFDVIESTSSGGAPANITAWYMSKMVSADLSDTIKFTYLPKSESYFRPSSQTYIWHNNPGSYIESFTTGFQGDYMMGTSISGSSLLSEISGRKGKLVFTTTATRVDITGGKELDKIQVFDKAGVLRRTFQFKYANYQSRLFLESVKEIGQDGTEKPPFKFTYEDPGGLPSTISMAQDYWGYFNGATGNTHLIPNTSSAFLVTDQFGSQLPSSLTPANRQSSETHMKKGVLKRIDYPTGGATEFDYQMHTFLNGVEELDLEDSQYVPAENGSTQISATFIPISASVTIDIRFNDYREPFNYPRPKVELQKLTNGTWAAPVGMIWQLPYPCLNNVVMHFNIAIQPGSSYRLVVTNEGCVGGTCNTPPANAYWTHAEVRYFDSNRRVVNTGGGLRVSEIRDFASDVSTSLASVRKFQYDSGLVVSVPVFKKHFIKHLCASPAPGSGCASLGNITCYSISSQSLVNLGTGQGSYVVYKKVREIYGASGENGYADNWFDLTGLSYASTFANLMPPFAPRENVDYRQGKLIKQVKYNSAGEKLEYIKNTFKNVAVGNANYHTIQGVRIMQQVQFSSYEPALQAGMHLTAPFNVTSRFVYQDSLIRTTYYKNGTSSTWTPITTVTQMFYENASHLQVTRSSQVASDGSTIESKTWFPQDYGTVDNLPALIGKNVLVVPVKEEVTKGGQLISGKVTRYNTDGKPIEIHIHESAIPATPPAHTTTVLLPAGYVKKVDLGYDATSKRLNRVQELNNAVGAYLWGYGNSLPIAEITNATAGDVAATSFEPDAKGNWTYSGASSNDIVVKTGDYYYKLSNGNVTRTLATGKFKLEYWAKGTVTLSGGAIVDVRTSAPDANGWILYEKEVTTSAATTLTISGATGLIDELRVYPVVATVKTFTYDPISGTRFVNDATNTITSYEYDGFGRLRAAKDQKGDIVKSLDYHYKGY
ncbi:hypothetical protein WBG78_15795 [Chryseolinea sp. T2]|uniref:hypothetical protein n=1 Tax=Chryseolinea sp. T2 TaxID=3129255 RepID=UPI003077E012